MFYQKVLFNLALSPMIVLANAATETQFFYQSESGQCLNAQGEAGLNSISKEELLKTKNGQCGDFREMDFRNTVAPNLDLRGADFRGAFIAFAAFQNARFEGANLSQTIGGYVQFSGQKDAFTVDPRRLVRTVER